MGAARISGYYLIAACVCLDTTWTGSLKLYLDTGGTELFGNQVNLGQDTASGSPNHYNYCQYMKCTLVGCYNLIAGVTYVIKAVASQAATIIAGSPYSYVCYERLG